MSGYLVTDGADLIARNLLRKYHEREVYGFIQIDAFNPQTGAIGYDDADPDGDELWRRPTVELMQGASVRVLIDPSVDRDAVVRMLGKIADWVTRDWDPARNWADLEEEVRRGEGA